MANDGSCPLSSHWSAHGEPIGRKRVVNRGPVPYNFLKTDVTFGQEHVAYVFLHANCGRQPVRTSVHA